MDPKALQHQSFFRKWGGLVILSLALAIIIIDTTLLNVSLKTIINDLHTNLKSMQWVITIYSLILAAFTITGGRLGDLYGRKKMFLTGAIIFAVGSFIASISKNIGMMIAGEAIIEGIGAALMMPATASLLITNFKGRDRSIAFGVWGGIAAASSAIGPILGGWLTTNYSWRWGFRINIFVVAIVLIGSFLIHEAKRLQEKTRIDLIGIILSAAGLLSLVFGFIQASSYGWFKAKDQLAIFGHSVNLGSLSATPVFIVLGLILLAIFVFWERKFERSAKTPLLSLGLFKNSQFVSGASTMAVLALGQAGLFFTIPVFLQAVRHLDALHTGLTLLPMSIALLVAAPLSAFLNKWIPPKYLVQTGLVMSIVAFIVLPASLSIDATAATLAPGFIIFGFGMGLIMSQVSNLTLSGVPVAEAGEASGVNNTLRMVGQTLGSAILGAILLSSLVTNVTNGIHNSQVIPAQTKQLMEAGVQSHISDISFGAQDNPNSGIPKDIQTELARITNQSTVDANKKVMVYGLVFIFLGLLVSTQLPNVGASHGPEEAMAAEAATASAETETEVEPKADDESKNETYAMVAAAAAIAPKEEVIQETVVTEEKKKSNWKLYAGIIAALLIIGGIVFATRSKDNNDKKNENVAVESTPDRPVEQSNNDSNNDSNTNSDTSNSGTAQDQVATTQEVVPNSTQNNTPAAPTTGAAPANSQNYSNPTLHFAFTIPSDWKVVQENGSEVVFKSAAGLYNVQSYDAQGGDWDSLRTYLQEQSNMSNVRRVMWGGRDLFQFDINSAYQTGVAFLENGRLYYVLGMGSENSALVNLKTF